MDQSPNSSNSILFSSFAFLWPCPATIINVLIVAVRVGVCCWWLLRSFPIPVGSPGQTRPGTTVFPKEIIFRFCVFCLFFFNGFYGFTLQSQWSILHPRGALVSVTRKPDLNIKRLSKSLAKTMLFNFVNYINS